MFLLVCFVASSQGIFVDPRENYWNSLNGHEDAGGWQLIKVYHPPKSQMWYKYEPNVNVKIIFLNFML